METESGDLVGYAIYFEDYMTDGVLLRETLKDANLYSYSLKDWEEESDAAHAKFSMSESDHLTSTNNEKLINTLENGVTLMAYK
nr:pre-mRNA-splicing factor ATP-dependent RNA helicase DEAH7 [Tanacetum cinerariifolium]